MKTILEAGTESLECQTKCYPKCQCSVKKHKIKTVVIRVTWMLVKNTEQQAQLLEVLIHAGEGGEWESVFLPPRKFEKHCYQQYGDI